MFKTARRSLALSVALACTVVAVPQDQGPWRATSKTASAITGDIAIGSERLAINLNVFPIAQIRALTPAEIAALFGESGVTSGAGFLYKVNIPASQKFLHKNTLCGAEDTQWIATAVQDRSLHVALFSGAKMPQLTVESIINSTDVCGTFLYSR